ncbi:MAG: hypothetical protein JNL01_11760 [Bdellovibrionales bacterium]|nr:hypothetical protein [Bdellovibrionales bacterium]
MGKSIRLDAFTRARIIRFIEDFRRKSGELPVLKDLDQAGFSKDVIDAALKEKVISQFYVTLSNGMTVKGFKVFQE